MKLSLGFQILEFAFWNFDIAKCGLQLPLCQRKHEIIKYLYKTLLNYNISEKFEKLTYLLKGFWATKTLLNINFWIYWFFNDEWIWNGDNHNEWIFTELKRYFANVTFWTENLRFMDESKGHSRKLSSFWSAKYIFIQSLHQIPSRYRNNTNFVRTKPPRMQTTAGSWWEKKCCLRPQNFIIKCEPVEMRQKRLSCWVRANELNVFVTLFEFGSDNNSMKSANLVVIFFFPTLLSRTHAGVW